MGFSDSSVVVSNIYEFAFPLMRNSSKKPVTVTGFEMATVPAGLSVLGYPVYSKSEVTAYMVDGADSPPLSAGNFLMGKPNHAGQPILIKPGEESIMYATVKLRLDIKTKIPMTGCIVFYTSGVKHYRQTLSCTFKLGD